MLMDTGELRRKWGLWRSAPWWPAVLLVLVQTLNGMWYMPQLSFFPVYLQELGLPPAAIGGVVAGAQLAGMAVALLGGWVAGLLGSKWVLVCGLALSGVASLAFQVHTPWLVAALWFIGGAGLALITVGGASYLTRLSLRGTLGMLAAIYALSLTVGGAIGTPIAGVIIERRGFSAFGWASTALIATSALLATFFMIYLRDRTAERAALRVFWSGALAMIRRAKVRQLLGLRSLPTIFYGMLTVLIPVLLNGLSGNKLVVAAYATTNLIVASAAQLLAGRAADRWGARGPTLVAYTAIILASLGLAATVDTVWGLYIFGVLGVAAAWPLSTLMYVWVADGVPKAEHASSFGLLHAVWSLSMITGSLLGGTLVRTFSGLPFLIAGLLNVGSLFLALAYYARPAARKVSS
jgi:MFS family permease